MAAPRLYECAAKSFFAPRSSGRLQVDVGGGDGAVEEDGRHAAEAVGIFGGKVADSTAAAEPLLHFGMAVQVVGEAVGHDAPLFHDGYAGGHVLTYLVDK